MTYLLLFWEFFKTGLFAIGGGLATLPFLTEMGDRTGWFSGAQLADIVAVSESTPGPLGVNMATYVGYLVGGIPGAVIATLGLVFPSVVIILIVAKFLANYGKNRFVSAAFHTLRPASTGLIASACVSVMLLSLVNLPAFESSGAFLSLFEWKSIVLAAILFVLTRVFKKLHPVVFIALSAAVGIVFGFSGSGGLLQL